jgi:hypothetical protein
LNDFEKDSFRTITISQEEVYPTNAEGVGSIAKVQQASTG